VCGNDSVTPAKAGVQETFGGDVALETGSPNEVVVQIAPLGIVLLDEMQLPLSLPLLQLLLAQDGVADTSECLVVYESVHAVTFGEAGEVTTAMLVDSTQETACHPDIERPVPFARQDVDVVRFHDECFLDSCPRSGRGQALRRNDRPGICRDYRNDSVTPCMLVFPCYCVGHVSNA